MGTYPPPWDQRLVRDNRVVLAAATSTLAFVTFTGWWLIDGGAGLDHVMLRFTGRLLRGVLDIVISDSWPLGEPQVAVSVVGVVAALLASRRRFRAAAVVVGGFLVLSGVQLVIVLVLAEIRHVSLNIDALSHLYPSGHTARVPFLGTTLALIAPSGARGWVLAITAVLSVALALDRTDSTIQTGSVVVGGLLLGIAVSTWFALVYSRWVGSRHDAITAR